MTIRLKRVYEAPSSDDGVRVLVERLWPRGMTREKAAIAWWATELAPSAALRAWFNHEPSRWHEFTRRYFAELGTNSVALRRLLRFVRRGPVTLVFSSRETRFNNAVALKEYVDARGRQR